MDRFRWLRKMVKCSSLMRPSSEPYDIQHLCNRQRSLVHEIYTYHSFDSDVVCITWEPLSGWRYRPIVCANED
jgi:hypothetical protein